MPVLRKEPGRGSILADEVCGQPKPVDGLHQFGGSRRCQGRDDFFINPLDIETNVVVIALCLLRYQLSSVYCPFFDCPFSRWATTFSAITCKTVTDETHMQYQLIQGVQPNQTPNTSRPIPQHNPPVSRLQIVIALK